MDFWWQKIEWKCSWIHAANWVTQNLRENFATLCPTKHDQLFLALKTDIVTIPPKPEHVVISHPWMNFWKKKERPLVNFHKTSVLSQKNPHEKSGMEVMAGSNGIPADAGGLPPVEKSPEEKCLGSESHETQGPGRRRYHGEPTFWGALTHNFGDFSWV